MKGDRSNYGRLRVLENPEAARLWQTRHAEPDDCGGSGLTLDQMQTTGDRLDDIIEGAKLWSLAEQHLSRSYCRVLQMRFRLGMTIQEVANASFVTRERIRQIEATALRRIRRLRECEQ